MYVCVISTSSKKVSLDSPSLYCSPFRLSQKPLIVPVIQDTFNEILIYIILAIWLGIFVYVISLNLLKSIKRWILVPFSYQLVKTDIKIILLEVAEPRLKTCHFRCNFLFTFIMLTNIELMYVDIVGLTHIMCSSAI